MTRLWEVSCICLGHDAASCVSRPWEGICTVRSCEASCMYLGHKEPVLCLSHRRPFGVLAKLCVQAERGWLYI